MKAEEKEKAKELVDKFYFAKDEDGYHSMNKYRAKQCALIAVDEIFDVLSEIFETYDEREFWIKVKQEIQKL